MFSLTHKLIANKVFESLKSELNVTIKQGWFLNGSIIPDVHPILMRIPHTKDKSSRVVQQNMEWLMEKGISSDNKKDMGMFSYKLGIITHFVSDYFCTAHNEQKYDNLLIHYLYERKLKKYCSQYFKNQTSLSRSFKAENRCLPGEIMEFVHEKHTEYNSIKRSMQNDIAYSVGVSTAVALNIVYFCIKNEKNACISPLNLMQKLPRGIIIGNENG